MHPAYLNLAHSIWVLFNSTVIHRVGEVSNVFFQFRASQFSQGLAWIFTLWGIFSDNFAAFPHSSMHISTFCLVQYQTGKGKCISFLLIHPVPPISATHWQTRWWRRCTPCVGLHSTTVSADSNLKLTLKRKLDKLRELWNPAVLYTVSVHKDYRGPR